MFLVRLSLLVSIVSTVIYSDRGGKVPYSKETVSAAVDSLNQGLDCQRILARYRNLSNSLPLTARSFHTT